MECLLIIRAVCVLLCATTIAFTSSEQTNNHHEGIRSTRDATQNAHYFFYQRSEYPRDCREVQQQCSTSNTSGVYAIKPDSFQEPFEVFCNNNVDTGGWTVIQRRENGSSMNFRRSWSQYKDGFGFLSTEFWLGNDKLSYLTNQALYELRVDFTFSNGRSFYTTYKGFRISDEWGQYQLSYISAHEIYPGPPSVCPTNMVYGNCICQATCENPNERSGCNSDCMGSEGCICPDGFLMQGSDCIYKNECDCFIAEVNFVIPNGEVYVNDDCTQNCSCNNNQLSCEDDYRCDANAVCSIISDVRQCSCIEGYEGDGQICDSLPVHTDCKDVYDSGRTQDGVYQILPSGWPGLPFNVNCKMDNGGGWTVFQRRTDDTISFYQNWAAYKEGFGDNINLWLGNEKLYYLTNQKNYKLRLDITTSDGSPLNAEYTEFQIESESTNYNMNKLGSRTTSSGGYAGSTLYENKGKQFSTYDRDNDACGHFNCAAEHRSGWWYWNGYCNTCYTRGSYCYYFQYNGNCNSACTYENLNGDYNGGNGENIFSNSNHYCNIRSVEMKIRPS